MRSSSSSPFAALLALVLLLAAAASSPSTADEVDLAPSGIHVVRGIPRTCRRVSARDVVEAGFLLAAGPGFVPSTKEGENQRKTSELNF